MDEPFSPRKNQQQLRYALMKMNKQYILEIRQRKTLIPQLPDPHIVQSFERMYKHKSLQLRKKMLQKKISDKKSEYTILKTQLKKYQEKYHEKQKSLKQKDQLFRVLTQKLENQYEKIKGHFIQVGFNKSITTGVRKINYYRLGEILFNPSANGVFQAIIGSVQNKTPTSNNLNNNGFGAYLPNMNSSAYTLSDRQMNNLKNQQEVGICIGYLGLLISIVGKISGARLWMQFTFKGSKSTIKLNDGNILVLRSRQNRYAEGINTLVEQLYQIMHYYMGIKIEKTDNLYQMCQQLSQALLS